MAGQRNKGEISILESGITLDDGITQNEERELMHYTVDDF